MKVKVYWKSSSPKVILENKNKIKQFFYKFNIWTN